MLIERLFLKQLQDWPLASQNYTALRKVEWKTAVFDGFEVKIQFNPGRIRSSAAPVENQSIEQRSCFLCNRPPEQQGIDYPPHYTILINPYPIADRHLTIVYNRHTPQRIVGKISSFLRLAEDLPDYVLLYNGPRSGASAPDHCHFQAVNKGFLPFEQDIHSYYGKIRLRESRWGSAYYMKNYLRSCFIFESPVIEWLTIEFERFFRLLHNIQPQEKEPMYNLITWKEANYWQLAIFPRQQHRPRQYYETGSKKILISPGVVDFGGVLITPQKEDFVKIDKLLIEDIYSQLSLNNETTQDLCRRIICQANTRYKQPGSQFHHYQKRTDWD